MPRIRTPLRLLPPSAATVANDDNDYKRPSFAHHGVLAVDDCVYALLAYESEAGETGREPATLNESSVVYVLHKIYG